MREAILLLVDIINDIHDVIAAVFGVNMTDKQLHFWVFGILGIIMFFFVYVMFKIISKMRWSIVILSFLYTFTVIVVLVFAIEIQQAYTQRGNMEFADAVMGLWGYIVFFAVYAVIAFIIYMIVQLYKKGRDDNRGRHAR
ncbi:hypothetical protein [Gracilibacillus alcaliphilus]|uniref:hypothetical protein n=1 Tax=Gracilibacillus alcaliphilus TaxID=1401441 RepID=UPI00195B7ED2|nr:hypothetical protein [Gracilibacillus alcaliphilus]MBM7676171.1 uncharacterized membrane protein YuzA (DUF378 family) [Gracilibacillus alcaliphilus]